jgi:hypothetical protein
MWFSSAIDLVLITLPRCPHRMYVNPAVSPPFVTSVHPGAAEPSSGGGRGHAPTNPPAFVPPSVSNPSAAGEPRDQYSRPPVSDTSRSQYRPPGGNYYATPQNYGSSVPTATPAAAPPYNSESSYGGTRQGYGPAPDRYQYNSSSGYPDPQSYSYGPSSSNYVPPQHQNYHPPTAYQSTPYQTGYESRPAGVPGGDPLPPPPPPPSNPPHHTHPTRSGTLSF